MCFPKLILERLSEANVHGQWERQDISLVSPTSGNVKRDICKFTLCGALGSHGHCLAVAPCSGPLGSPSGSEGEPWGDSWPWCLGPGDSAALAHVGGNRRGVDLF